MFVRAVNRQGSSDQRYDWTMRGRRIVRHSGTAAADAIALTGMADGPVTPSRVRLFLRRTFHVSRQEDASLAEPL